MYAYKTAEYIKDMGTPKRYEEVINDFNSGKKVYTPNSGASRTNQGQLVTSGGTTEPAPAAPVQDPDVDFDDAYGGNFRGPF